MTYDEYFNLILNSEPEDWLFFDEEDVLTFKNDLNIWIKRVITDEPFEEEWAKRNPNPEAYKVDVKFYYGNSLVDTDLYVSVDGYRAIVPLTNSRDSYDVKKSRYIIAKILNHDTNGYIERRYLNIFNVVDG